MFSSLSEKSSVLLLLNFHISTPLGLQSNLQCSTDYGSLSKQVMVVIIITVCTVLDTASQSHIRRKMLCTRPVICIANLACNAHRTCPHAWYFFTFYQTIPCLPSIMVQPQFDMSDILTLIFLCQCAGPYKNGWSCALPNLSCNAHGSTFNN